MTRDVPTAPEDSPERREARARSFDAVAGSYALVRPAYPSAVFDAIAAVAPPPASVLEIGPGPGFATLPMAERGYRILAIELGPALARVARRRLKGHPQVRIAVADFHVWHLTRAQRFDLVLAASSFHFIDPSTALSAVHAALRPSGWLAQVANHPRPGRVGSRARAFWEATDRLYRRQAPTLAARRGSSPSRIPDRRTDMRRSGLFDPIRRLSWTWRHEYASDGFLGLIDTFSDHRLLPAAERSDLFAAVRDLIDTEFGGCVVREYRTDLYLAQRRG